MIIVLDIGKTNKKVILFNDKLEILETRKKVFNEIEQADGIRVEQTKELESWFIEQLADLAKEHDIDAISITTHSTNVVCLDKDDNLSIPTIAYTNEAGKEIDQLFFDRFGNFEKLQEETATAAIGSMINTARILHFAQIKYKDDFAKTKKILFYPQFFGYVLTGKVAIESTSLGSHTYLFNPYKKTYSRIAEELGLTEFLPKTISKPWDVIGRISREMSERTGIKPECIVTTGIHDSNSSLLPYLINNEKEFVLNSTGTWCVIMRPDKDVEFHKEELGRTVYYNIDAYNAPVKTIIFMGGAEYETYSKMLEEHFEETGMPEYEKDIYNKVLTESSFLYLPSVIKGVGIYPESKPMVVKNGKRYSFETLESSEEARNEVFTDRKESYAALNASLVAQTVVALGYTGFTGNGSLYTEGGFVNNTAYTQLLADSFPDAEVSTTNLKEATAIGAALLAISALEGVDPKDIDKSICQIEKRRIPHSGSLGTAEYTKAFTHEIIS